MKGLRSAAGFLTILPVAPRKTDEGLSAAGVWFPAVGLLLGAMLSAIDLLLRPSGRELPPLLVGVVLVGALAVLTRGLHLDGFMDTCDGLLGGYSRERRLEILRDPHVGAFAVVGVVCLLLVKCTALGAIPSESRLWVILFFPCLFRWAMLAVMGLFPYARSEGLGTVFLPGSGRWRLVSGLVVTIVAGVALTGWLGLVLVALAGLVAWAVGAWAVRLLGGVTGDIYGAAGEAVEASTLVLAMILTLADPGALSSPLAALL